MRANTIDLETLEELFHIDEDFNLRWKVKRNGNKGIDSIAGYISSFGYRVVEYKEKGYRVHRVIYQMINNIELLDPNLEIDHIDCNKLNNHINNLRCSTAMQNSRNREKHIGNTSGYKGISFDKKCRKKPWRAIIGVNYKRISLGYYATKEEAYAAYCEGAIKYHKEFSCLE